MLRPLLRLTGRVSRHGCSLRLGGLLIILIPREILLVGRLLRQRRLCAVRLIRTRHGHRLSRTAVSLSWRRSEAGIDIRRSTLRVELVGRLLVPGAVLTRGRCG